MPYEPRFQFYDQYIVDKAQLVVVYFRDEHPHHICTVPNECQHDAFTLAIFDTVVGVQVTESGVWMSPAWEDNFVEAVCQAQTAGSWNDIESQCCDVFTYLAVQSGHFLSVLV